MALGHPDTSSIQSCETFVYDFDENIGLSAVFGTSFFIGLLLIFYGYRLFRFSLFLQCFSLVSFIMYLILIEVTTLSNLISSIIASTVGFILGLISAFVVPMGIVSASFIQSLFASTCIFYVIELLANVEHFFIPPTVTVLLFVALLLPALKWQRKLAIVYVTSFGAILLMLTMDYFLTLSMLRKSAYENMLSLPRKNTPCWFSWTILGLWPIMMFLGCVVQFIKTAYGFDHRANTSGKHWIRQDSTKQRLLSRSKNDVIAKAWIQTSTPVKEKLSLASISQMEDDDVFSRDNTTPV